MRALRYENLESRRMLSTYYVDATGGDDSWDGLAGSYVSGTHGPWKTIQKVNSETQTAGDSVLFKCGEVWREGLLPDSGSALGRVTYGSYGEGEKPLLMGSMEFNAAADWMNMGGNIWSTKTGAVYVSNSELLSNPSFDSNTSGWTLNATDSAVATGYRDTSVYDSSPAGYSIDCTDNSGTIKLYTGNISLETGEYYKLTFRAKSTSYFTLSDVSLANTYGGAPWANNNLYDDLFITTDWQTYTVVFEALATVSSAQLSFHLNDIPNGATFSIDTLSFQECYLSDTFLPYDVGNIIFDGGDSCGVKKWDSYFLKNQGDYLYDPDTYTVQMYSTSNPAYYYSDIELALGRSVVQAIAKSYITIENLAITDGGRMGISTAFVHHFDVRNCDISFMGGSLWKAGSTTRLGNGIEFYDNTNDVLVENCKIWDIYDAGLTNQTAGIGYQHDITYRNNIIWNCEYSYEYFQRAGSETYNIYFENNTCAYAGYGWAHDQRSDKNGAHLMLWTQQAELDDFYIRNNIFYESTQYAIRLYEPWTDLANLTLDYNLYYESSGYVASWMGTYYNFDDFDSYVSASGKDAHSIAADPDFDGAASYDFHLESTSPAIDAGTNTGSAIDYDGTFRPLNVYYDMGAYEAFELIGDANYDGTVDQADSDIVSANWLTQSGATRSTGDFNNDGRVNCVDATLLAANWLKTLQPAVSYSAATVPEPENQTVDPPLLPGDANRDGTVDDKDAVVLAANWKKRSAAAWSDGDFTGDGRVDEDDARLLALNWQKKLVSTAATSAVTVSDTPVNNTSADETMVETSTLLPGDANRDGTVDDKDAAALAANWKKQSAAAWSDGDFTGDGIIDEQDVSILAQYWMMTKKEEGDK